VPRFLPDTSCLVAALCTWHEHHERAAQEIERRLANEETLVVAAPALVETYAVLTRLPAPHRLSPVDSRALLEANFLGGTVEMVALAADAYRHLLYEAPERGIAGGNIYDGVLVACGQAARADAILTFNARHFDSLAVPGIAIVVPS
jgi:predicted nucleic acid-binding protein